eukprot:Gregarina_sp_Poly_1__7854@NODE_445_length_8333_cov_573_313090_g363_i0_p2_GENE_NODE_445_length_8333_cov_573_313090_g363_i0NODE_445_length_8333_cov_573_313090_g363_i0_p2_ORF_typecomplete_len781_score87_69MORN/PF02493_20/3_1e03MORN/PF02493_20/1_2e02MORN/PF02493_20/7_1e05MORN/PF02493_20/0_6MORN/PF02493_20/0_00015MORN/PF02493_20/0_0029MORN/PF02493_20/0_00061MORN/PF02493_20/8_9e07MORN/PF02493_20/0_0032MORN/PF02493_20/0_00015MORN/PF02493_20/2_2e05MORN/PF02493_20/1_3e04MORN/PF02493_20/1_7e04DUF3048_C/PF
MSKWSQSLRLNNDTDAQSDYTWVTDVEDEESTVSGTTRARPKRLVWSDGTVFEGNLNREKKPQGPGELRASNGDFYRGEWQNGKMHGSGIYIVAEGGQYEGFVKNNERSGFGKLVSPAGAVYEGYWLNDKPHGQGRFSKANNNVSYEGSWVEGKADGYGTFNSSKWGTYVGEWKADKKEGKGKVLYVSGASYEGGWVADEAHGWGRYTWPDGSCYEGRFANGSMSGPGKFYSADGSESFFGSWSNNQKSGYGRMRYSDGAVYEGEWKEDKPHGFGTFVNPYGVMFRGRWEAGAYTATAESCHDARGVRTCMVEGITHVTENSSDRLIADEDINARTVIPAPPPGHSDVELHLPCPRKHLTLVNDEIFEEKSDVFESVVYPRGPDPTRSGYLYRTCFGTEYWPSTGRSKLTEMDGGRLVTVDSESRLFQEEDDVPFVDHSEVTELYQETIVQEGGHGETNCEHTTNHHTAYLPATREYEYGGPHLQCVPPVAPPFSHNTELAGSGTHTVPYTAAPQQIHTVSTVQEEQSTYHRQPAAEKSTTMSQVCATHPNMKGFFDSFAQTSRQSPRVPDLQLSSQSPSVCTVAATQSNTAYRPYSTTLETSTRIDYRPPLNPGTNAADRSAPVVEQVTSTVDSTTFVSQGQQNLNEQSTSTQQNTANQQETVYEEITLQRNIPCPVEYSLVTEFVLPRLRPTTRSIPIPVYAPRLIEVPVLVEDLSDEGLRICEDIEKEVDAFYEVARKNGVNGTALETFADGMVQKLQSLEKTPKPQDSFSQYFSPS